MHPEKFYKYVIERTLIDVPEPERSMIKQIWSSKIFKKKTLISNRIKHTSEENISNLNKQKLLNQLRFYPNFIKMNNT